MTYDEGEEENSNTLGAIPVYILLLLLLECGQIGGDNPHEVTTEYGVPKD